MKIELRPIDRHFADFICRESGNPSEDLWFTVALTSNAVGQGHICLDLSDMTGQEFSIDGFEWISPQKGALELLLKHSAAVGGPGDFRPLVLDASGRLYLHRYWKYEQDLARIALEKAKALVPLSEEILREGMYRLFPKAPGNITEWQAVAAVAALRKRFSIISGGPGTGKTSTVVKILALMLEQRHETELRIALAAPTGKAAARLKESITKLKEALACSEETRQRIPSAVSTIHRLLGTVTGSVRFRYSSENRLPFDVVIIDEASMVDLPLMAKLVTALADEAHLILLGDREQLSSVEAGAVLGDLCGGGRPELFSKSFSDLAMRMLCVELSASDSMESELPLADSLVLLKKNYRFQPGSGIAELASAVNAGKGQQALDLMSEDRQKSIQWHDIPAESAFKKALAPVILNGYTKYLSAGTPEEALAAFDFFRVLCALREGMYGVGGVTKLIEEILADNRLIDPRRPWYRGRPVMVTANDYSLKLFNGDVGLVLPEPGVAQESLRVYFQSPDGGLRSISTVRLPPHETVYAMTVHKSQGSEFERILMLLPDHSSAALSRELVYTGITRAKSELAIWGRQDVFISSVAKRAERKSGLAEILWKG